MTFSLSIPSLRFRLTTSDVNSLHRKESYPAIHLRVLLELAVFPTRHLRVLTLIFHPSSLKSQKFLTSNELLNPFSSPKA